MIPVAVFLTIKGRLCSWLCSGENRHCFFKRQITQLNFSAGEPHLFPLSSFQYSTSVFGKKTDYKHLCKAANSINITPEVSHCCWGKLMWLCMVPSSGGCGELQTLTQWISSVINIISRFISNYEQHIIMLIVSICIFKPFISLRINNNWHISHLSMEHRSYGRQTIILQ